jgi:hypothetical protein
MDKRYVVLFLLVLGLLVQCQGFVQYAPAAAGVIGYCSMNPHSCVRTMVNTVDNVNKAVDWAEERHKRQVEQERTYKENLQKHERIQTDLMRLRTKHW